MKMLLARVIVGKPLTPHSLLRCGLYQADRDVGVVRVPPLMPPEPPVHQLATVAPKYTSGDEEGAARCDADRRACKRTMQAKLTTTVY